MADISRLDARIGQQGRPTNNRDGVLPSRRNTEAPRLEINADLRNGRRGEGGADELMRVLGGLTRAAGNVQETMMDGQRLSDQQQAELDHIDGLQDQLAGTIDPEQRARSAAYNNAVTTGEAVKATNAHLAELEQAAEAMLNNPDDPATVAEIAAMIAERQRSFLLNLDGTPRDWGSKQANFEVAKLVQGTGDRLTTASRAAIQKQVEERSIATSVTNFTTALARGDAPDIETHIRTLAPGTDLTAAKKSFLGAAVSYAEQLIPDDAEEAAALGVDGVRANVDRAKKTLDALIASKRADGFASFSPEGLASLRDQRARLAAGADNLTRQVEAVVQARTRDAFRDRLLGVGGTYPSTAEIVTARRSNSISSEHADQLLGIIESDRREAEADARRGVDDDDKAGPGGAFGESLLADVYMGNMSTKDAQNAVIRAAGAGMFGGGTTRKKRMTAVIEEIKKVEEGRKAGTETRGFQLAVQPLTSTIDELSRISDRDPRPSVRKAARAWLKAHGGSAVSIVGRRYVEKEQEPGKTADAVGRELIRQFRQANPKIKLR